ncbi:MAG: response regulator [Deltaproteobacteria bacterium]|nr:response regulator [Deltaproteobacteria bacterium]
MNGTVLSILIAEDDLNLGEALAGFLRDKGHHVDLAINGREAQDLLLKGDYSLVITDLVLPEADGMAVLRAAKQKDKATLVVVMTGYASLDSAMQAIREGAYDYLRKPFKLQEIDIAVANAARLLVLHRQNQELLQKLDVLTAKLTDLAPAKQNEVGGEQPMTDARSFSPSFPFPRLNAVSNRRDQCQADLLRLRHLYQESLITEGEYQTLKQRLCI